MNKFIIVLVSMLFSGCVALDILDVADAFLGPYVDKTKLNTPPDQLIPKSTEDIELYRKNKPLAKFVEIFLYRSYEEGYTTEKDLLEVMLKTAAADGCDGLFIEEIRVVEESSTIAGTTPTRETSMNGVCIVYLPE